MAKSALGRKLSLETRTKISQALKNNKNSLTLKDSPDPWVSQRVFLSGPTAHQKQVYEAAKQRARVPPSVISGISANSCATAHEYVEITPEICDLGGHG